MTLSYHWTHERNAFDDVDVDDTTAIALFRVSSAAFVFALVATSEACAFRFCVDGAFIPLAMASTQPLVGEGDSSPGCLSDPCGWFKTWFWANPMDNCFVVAIVGGCIVCCVGGFFVSRRLFAVGVS